LPFQRHQCLVDRIMLDDPDNFAGAYQAGEEKHGADNTAIDTVDSTVTRAATPPSPPQFPSPSRPQSVKRAHTPSAPA